MKIVFTFYLSFHFASNLITLACGGLLFMHGLDILTLLILLKLITSGLIILYINLYKKKEFYYYHNLGYSRVSLWSRAMGLDFTIFISLLIILLWIL